MSLIRGRPMPTVSYGSIGAAFGALGEALAARDYGDSLLNALNSKPADCWRHVGFRPPGSADPIPLGERLFAIVRPPPFPDSSPRKQSNAPAKQLRHCEHWEHSAARISVKRVNFPPAMPPAAQFSPLFALNPLAARQELR